MWFHKRVSLIAGAIGLCASYIVEIDAASNNRPVLRPLSTFDFEKNASQYCLPKLSAEEQSQVFSRMMNLGASYSHGCTQCDAGLSFRNQLIVTNDLYFVRRNYLAQFLERAPWKAPHEFKFEFLSVLENDAGTNLAQMFPLADLQSKGYDGKWAFYPDKMHAELLSLQLENYAKRSPGFKDESSLVGNGFLRKNLLARDLSRKGHIYQSVPGTFSNEGAKQKIIFDLATDRSRSFEILRTYGDAKVYDRLVRSGWNDTNDRTILISKTVSYLRSFEVGSVFAPDAMFWDAVPAMFARAKEQNPKSLFTKLVASPLFSKMIGLEYFSADQRERMQRDYFEVLSRLSRNNGAGKSIPVFFGRLIDAPGQMIRSRGLENEFGALIGNFIEVFTGHDLERQIGDELKKKSWFGKFQGLSKLWNWGSRDKWMSNQSHFQNKPQDENDLTETELLQAKIALNTVSTESVKPALPWIARGAVNAAILNALGDLPLLVGAADWAFKEQNRILREVASDKRNNIQLLNVDAFFNDFHTIVNQFTMHPSVKGAGAMADLVEQSLCASDQSDFLK